MSATKKKKTKKRKKTKSRKVLRKRIKGSKVFTREEWRSVARSLKLSPRQLQIVRLFFDDKTQREIAEELRISPHTVASYIRLLYKKLGVTSKEQITVRVFAAHLALRS